MSVRDPHHVCALLYEQLTMFEFAIAAEIFGLSRPEFGSDWYTFTTASDGCRPVVANTGVVVQPMHDLTVLATAATIVLPGWPIESGPPSDELHEQLHKAHAEGARLISICSGAFLLAELGLLDGKRATTHWRYADTLAERYPCIDVDPDVLFVDDDVILTSAGSAAGIDLLLHVIRKDFGSEQANSVARGLVMPPHRDGNQKQFIDAPVASSDSDKLRPLLQQVRAAPSRDWSIDEMASRAAMSRRTFIRKFRAATGQSPTGFVRQVRLKHAQAALERTTESLDTIAYQAGFGSLASMNYHFAKALACSPSAYRQRFRHSD